MAHQPYHGGPVAMSRPQAAQHPYNAQARHQQANYAHVRFANTPYKRSEDEETDEDSKSDQAESTDDEHEEESPAGTHPPSTMGGFQSSGGVHHSLQRERLADPAFASQPFRASPGAGTIPVSSTSAPRAKPPPLSAQRSMPEAASRPIPVPVPPQRASTTLSGSPSRSSGFYPTGGNSSYGAPGGSWGSGSDRDRGSLGERGPKTRPTLPGHDDWRTGTDSPVTATEKPRIWKPRPDASPPSSPATLAPKASLESLRTGSAVPLSSSPTTSTLRRESSNAGLRASAVAHGHVSNLTPVPELSRAPSTPTATSAGRNPGQKIWHPPSAEYERQHEEAAAELKEKEREQMRIATSSSTMAMAGGRGSRPGSSASVYASSPASYSPVVPKHGSPYPSSRDSIFSTVSTATSYTSAGTYVQSAQHLSESPPSSPQLFPHTIPDSPMPNRRSSTYEPVSSTSMSRPSRSSSTSTSTPARARPPPITGRRAAPVTISAELDSDEAEWVRVLRQEHVARFEAQKKLVEDEFQYKWLDIAKREAEAALKPSSNTEDFQAERARVKADFDQQMTTLQMLEDGNLQDAIATEEASRRATASSSVPGAAFVVPPELWEENMRAEQEIALEQIKRERSASVDQGPGPSRPPDTKEKDKDSAIHARSEEDRAAALQREKAKLEEEQRKRAASKDDWERNKASMREATIRREARKAAAHSDESGEETEDDDDGDVEMEQAFPPIKTRRPSDPPAVPRKQPPSRSATMPDASAAAATAASVQPSSRSQPPRQGSVPMDIPGARARPPMARGDSYSTDSGRDAPKPSDAPEPTPPTQRERHVYSMTFGPGERTEPGPQRRSSNASVPSTPATPNMPHATPAAHAKVNSPYATVPPSSLGGDPKPARQSSSSSVSSPRPNPQAPSHEQKDAFAEAAARRQREQAESEARRQREQAELDAARRQREREAQAQAQADAERERAQQRRESEERERERQKRAEEERAQQKREAEEREKLRREAEERLERQKRAEQERERQRREELDRARREEQERVRREEQERVRREEQERVRREEQERARRDEQERARREAEKRDAERRAADERARRQREAADRERERLKREAEQLQREEEFARREEEARRRYQDRKRQEDEEKERRRYASSSNTSTFPGSPPPFSSSTPGTPSSFTSASTAAAAPTSGGMERAWAAYEKAWTGLPDKAAKAPLRWNDIPWPMILPPRRAEGLVNGSIANFILSPTHSQGKSPKERLRDALLRWHPDRFESRWLPKCADSEREEIKNGVGFVVRCLNELMSVQSTLAAS